MPVSGYRHHRRDLGSQVFGRGRSSDTRGLPNVGTSTYAAVRTGYVGAAGESSAGMSAGVGVRPGDTPEGGTKRRMFSPSSGEVPKVSETKGSPTGTESDREFMERMMKLMGMFSSMMGEKGKEEEATRESRFRMGGGTAKTFQKVILDEKYFRRVDRYDGDVGKYKSWRFDLFVALGQVDKELEGELRGVLRRWEKSDTKSTPDKWEPGMDRELNQEVYKKYSGELYGVLVALTGGEAKSILRGIFEGCLLYTSPSPRD